MPVRELEGEAELCPGSVEELQMCSSRISQSHGLGWVGFILMQFYFKKQSHFKSHSGLSVLHGDSEVWLSAL